MRYDIFENNEDRDRAKELMPQLIKDEAWKFVVKALEANIKYLTDQLTDDEFEDLLEVKLKQRQRAYLTDLLHLPENILLEAAPLPKNSNDDIYE